MVNQIIFKSYDIRGVYPQELDKETAYQIGRAFVKLTGAKRVAVAWDARLSGADLFDSLTRGLVDQGADVFSIGQALTECLYFAVGNYDFDSGIMITASHNPKEYNGFKMLVKKGSDIEIIRGKDLFVAIGDGKFEDVPQKGKILQKDIWDDFIKHILTFWRADNIKPIDIAIDASNGVAGLAILKIGQKIPNKVFLLNHEPDGNFPNHSPNPLAQGSSNQIKNEILKEKAAFGFIFDGDADRIFLVDEGGELVRADVTLLLLAKYFLEKNPGSAIAYNAICSKAVPEFIEKWGGKPVRTQVGFVNVREGLMKNNGIMGGELSGHYCFKDNYYLDSGIIALFTLLLVISKDGRRVSEIAKELSPYAKGVELNFEVNNKEEILEKVKQKYVDGQQDFLDGVTVIYNDWWFNVRASNTEPLLRLTVEANSREMLDAKITELTDFVKK